VTGRASGRRATSRPWRDGAQHPTSNIQHPTSNGAWRAVGRSLLGWVSWYSKRNRSWSFADRRIPKLELGNEGRFKAIALGGALVLRCFRRAFPKRCSGTALQNASEWADALTTRARSHWMLDVSPERHGWCSHPLTRSVATRRILWLSRRSFCGAGCFLRP
jgi:hypothetical protein